MLFSKYALFFVALYHGGASEAFLFPSTGSAATTASCSTTITTATTTTSLAAMPPPMIIGGMLKKMREEDAKKAMPMAEAEEAAKEAVGLRVGADVWKWPPVWPYDDNFFTPTALAEAPVTKDNISSVASMISGVAQVPTSSTATDSDTANGATEEDGGAAKFDPLEYWGTQNAEVKTSLDAEAAEKLRNHYDFYLKDGMSILEIGAAEDSYLPTNLKPSRHVGVGGATKLMASNPSLTETLAVDLNIVEKERDIDNDDFRRLAQEPFDAILMANTVDYLTYPREVFRSAWYLLKPGGTMIVSFSGKEASKDKFPEAQTKMWREYNDDQHLWITGSFFEFSAGDGWERLLGFDISPDSAKKPNQNRIQTLLDRGKANNMYVVQATKGTQDSGIDPENVEKSIGSLCWMLPTLESRDKTLCLPRLARAYESTSDPAVRNAIETNIAKLPILYEALVKMDTFAFTFSMQAQLAADLVSDPLFTASDEQILALKQGLGLRAPTPEFWAPIGENTANMDIEEKISLLGYIVPRFDSGDAQQEQSLQDFATGLKPTYSVIRSKCPELEDADVELLGTELLAAELLTVGRSSRDEFAAWLTSMSSDELQTLLVNRKSIRATAKSELEEYREEKIAEKEQIEEYRRIYDEQIQTAREERSMIFNPKTQKMQVFDNPLKKK